MYNALVSIALHYLHIVPMCCLIVYYLVSWIKEDAVSVVPSKAIIEENRRCLPTWSLCQLCMKDKIYKAEIVASGMY